MGSMRQGCFGGVFLADLPLESLNRVRAARAMISPARREKPCTSTGAGGVIGSKDNGCSPPCLWVDLGRFGFSIGRTLLPSEERR